MTIDDERTGPDAESSGGRGLDEPVPESPEEAGVAPRVADASHQEGAHLLANEARPRLEDAGFSDRQVLTWAETYLESEGGGDVDSFIAWIERQEAAEQ